MSHNDLTLTRGTKILGVVLSIALGLLAVYLTLTMIFALHDILLWILANLLIHPEANSNYDAVRFIDVASECSAGVFGILCLGLIVVGSDYFFKHAGQRRLIRILAGLIVVECLIIVPVALAFWRT